MANETKTRHNDTARAEVQQGIKHFEKPRRRVTQLGVQQEIRSFGPESEIKQAHAYLHRDFGELASGGGSQTASLDDG